MQIRRLISRLSAWLAERRKQRQRQDLRARLMAAWMALHELGQYVDRDRLAERRERDRLVRQIDAARLRQDELEALLRAYLVGQAVIDSQVETAASRARASLESGFSGLDDPADFPQTTG